MKLHVRFQTFGLMNRDIIRTEIRDLVEVIREQQEIILAHTGNIPQIELDILMGNVRKLYERLWGLQKGSGLRSQVTGDRQEMVTVQSLQKGQESQEGQESNAAATATATDRTHSHSPSHSEPAPAPAPSVQPEELLSAIETTVQAPVSEISNEVVLPQANLSQERAKEFSKPSAKATPLATLFDEPETLADKFPGQASLYDKISATKEDKSLASKLQKNPVSDLKKSIGINEKFAFINELFDGDLNEYNNAIEQLNNSSNYEEANSFLQNVLIAQYNWNDESESLLKLRNLLERRFVE